MPAAGGDTAEAPAGDCSGPINRGAPTQICARQTVEESYWTTTAGGSAYNLLGLNERLDALVAVAPHDTSLGFLQAAIDLPLPALDGTFLDGGRLEVNGDISRSDPDLAGPARPTG